jgi:hypothetical protein
MVQPDFRELLALFVDRDVEFLIVGSYALAFHGAPRYTGDIDILVNPTNANAERVIAALDAFGFGSLGLAAGDFTQTDQVVQLGQPPVRVDLLTSISGVSWEEAANGAVPGDFGDVRVRYLGVDEFVTNKRASGMQRDLADIAALGRADS